MLPRWSSTKRAVDLLGQVAEIVQTVAAGRPARLGLRSKTICPLQR